MGGGLGAARARVREYRRWIEYRRQADQASSYLDKRDRASSGGRPSGAAGGDDRSKTESESPVRRTLLSAGAALTLALVAVAAISLGVSELNQKPQPDKPYAAVKPSGSAPGSFVSSSPTAAAARTGYAPTTAPPANTSLSGEVSGTAPAVAPGSAADTAPAMAANSPAATVTPEVSASPTLLDLCRSVVAAGTSWPSVLKGADRATVIAAAGKKNAVLSYCTGMVAGTPTP